MADADDVNAQHLAAMGLSEVPLGQPYEEPKKPSSISNRCLSRDGDQQCARERDHDGRHARGHHTWDDEGTSVSDQAQHCEETVAHEPHRWGNEEWYCHGLGTNPHEPEWCFAPNPRNDAMFCGRLRDHDGEHQAGAARWRNEPTKQREGDQVLPQGGGDCVQDRIIADMEESKRVGLERYGSVLRAFNGRRSIVDVHEEVRDLFVYLTQVRVEAEADRETLVQRVADVVDRQMGSMFPNATITRRAVAVEFAGSIVDTVLGYVVEKTNDLAWGHTLVEAYFNNTDIDFQGASVPESIQAHIQERTSRG